MKFFTLIVFFLSINISAFAFFSAEETETKATIERLIEEGERLLEDSPEKTIELASQALQLAQSLNDEEGAAKAYLLTGKAFNEKGEHKNGLPALKKATHYFHQKKNIESLGQALYEQGYAFYRMEELDSALWYLEKALDTFHPEQHKKDIALTEWRTALAWWRQGMYLEGLMHIQKAQILFEELNELRYMISVYNSKGAILWGLASYEKALELFFEALHLNETENILPDLNIVLLNNIGLVYHDWDNHENALKYFKRAEELIPESNHPVGAAYTWLNLGTHYLRKGEIDTALDLLSKARDGYAKVNDINGVCLSKIRIGECYQQTRELMRAQTTFIDAVEDSRQTRNKHREANALYYLAKNYHAMNDWELALATGLESLEISETGQYKELAQMNYSQLAGFYENMGDHGQALEMIKSAMEVKDEIYKERIAIQYNIMDLAYDYQIKEMENSRLKSENLLKQRTIYFMLGAVFLIVAWLIAMLYFNFKLKKRKAALQEANMAKDRIFSIVAHDLRSPVGTLNSMVDILVEEDHGMNYRDLLKKYKPVIAASFNMLENLLVWAKSNLGKLDTAPGAIPLNKSIEESVAMAMHFSQKKSIDIEFQNGTDIQVWGDKVLLETVIRNLLNNAIKFTQTDGKVSISTKAGNGHAVISVSDTGVGIPPNTQATLLKGNHQTEGTGKEKGSGLGLMLSKDLAERNGGSLWFSSFEGEGSTFSFSIPLYSGS
jgi:signal transduction histidine kinase